VEGRPPYFDGNNNNQMDASDIRLYMNGTKAQFECASCHDAHGVPSDGRDSAMVRTFLRLSNDRSALCFTCHAN
jgi:predicted CXXCH cytochrome family protein